MRVPIGRRRSQLTGNKARDQPSPGLWLTSRRVNSALRERGWTVIRIWEHELAKKNTDRLLRRLSLLLD